MIMSMTGYGRAECDFEQYSITVELRSVNHRYFEFSCRTTRGYSFLEDKIKKYNGVLLSPIPRRIPAATL